MRARLRMSQATRDRLVLNLSSYPFLRVFHTHVAGYSEFNGRWNRALDRNAEVRTCDNDFL